MNFSRRVYQPYKKGDRVDTTGSRKLFQGLDYSFVWEDALDQELSLPDGFKDSVPPLLKMLDLSSKDSPCERKKIGCVIVDNDCVVHATGANVLPKGLSGSCATLGCTPEVTCRLTVHAEVTALKSLKPSVGNLIVVSSACPCLDCMKNIVSRGITTCVYLEERPQPAYDQPVMAAITLSGRMKFIKINL